MPLTFDRNQTSFESGFHREVWWWATGMVPLDVSLTEETKAQCSPDVLKGCYQWHEYFGDLCADMYENADSYLPGTPRQFRDVLERASAGGEIIDEGVVWDANRWDEYVSKTDRSKAYRTSGLSVQYCLRALSRLGMEARRKDGEVIITNERYPKIFHAMRVMEYSPNARDTVVRQHFACCEFRQLFKSFNPGHQDLMRRGSDDAHHIARELHDFAKENKMIRYIHFGIIKYRYKGVRICDYNLHCHDTPTIRMKIGPRVLNPTASDLPLIYDLMRERMREVDGGGE